jgi:hypothetical protein
VLEPPYEDRLVKLRDMATRNDVDPNDIGGKNVGYLTVVSQAAAETKALSNRLPPLMWQVCSGLAHGELWATTGTLDREVVAVQGDVVTMSLTPNDRYVRLRIIAEAIKAARWPDAP